MLTYTAPTDPALTLDASATYMVVFKAPPSGDLLRVDATSNTGEDSSSLAGWSIRDKFQWNNGGAWQDASGSRGDSHHHHRHGHSAAAAAGEQHRAV